MNDLKKDLCRDITAYLTAEVAKKGEQKFGSIKFSFKDLMIVERNDKLRLSKGVSVKKMAAKEGLSRQWVYEIRKRK
jgi:hypothetical protein